TVVNIDNSNAKATVSGFDSDSFVRGNVIRNSGINRLRFSTESQQPPIMSNKDGMSKTVVDTNAYEETCIVTGSRPFLVGHSRAASADISSDSNSLNSTPITTTITNSNLQQQVMTSKMSHHIRNNSVDNSLVTSVFSTPGLTVKQTNTSTINNQPPPNKPAVPLKPAGIVSVFVPGSNTTATGPTLSTSNAGKKTGLLNVYGKLVTTTSVIPAKTDNSDNGSHISRYSNEIPVQQTSESGVHHHPIPPPRKVKF
ncbi:hypothetical protein BLA29_009825, partial [Euroglyphus maynei]